MNPIIRRGRSRVHATIQLFATKEGRYWVAVAPALRVTGYGKTEEQALDSFKVELEMFLEEAIEKRTLHDLLIQYGWTLNREFALPPSTEIPVELLGKGEAIQTHQRRIAIPV